MLEIFAGAAMLCCTVVSTTGHEPVDTVPEIDDYVELQEIVVRSSNRIARADRNVILPPQDLVKASANGRDLLGRLHLPRISVNALTGEITMHGGGKVTLAVNGVISSSSEVAGIPAGDVIKVEHIDNPGPRYPDTDILINIVTRRHNSGGNVSANLMNAFKKGGEADIDNLSVSYNRGKSQWAYSGELMRLRRDNWTRDYNEVRRQPDGSALVITERGEPSLMELMNLNNTISYSLADDGHYMFNAKFGLINDRIPHSEEADRTTTRYSSADGSESFVYEHMGERSTSPSLDLYGLYRLPSGANIIADVVATYIDSESDHVYRQTGMDGTCWQEINSVVDGRKYSLISELVYNRRWDIHTLDFGIRHFQSFTRNRYGGDIESVTVAMHQAGSSAYGRYAVMAGNVNMTGSLGFSRFYTSQSGSSQSKFMFTPSIGLAWTPYGCLSLRYKARLFGKMPSLADMNDVEQAIEPGYVRRGNPDLKAYRVFEQDLSAAWQCGWLSVDLSVPFSKEFKPIMEHVAFEDGRFVRSVANQRSFLHVGLESTVSISPWKDHLRLSLTPTLDHYRSRGNDFKCSHTLKNLLVDAEFTFGKWQLGYNTMTGYANYMYGSKLMKERNMSMVMAGYKAENYSAKIGVLDPFVRTYWMETRDLSPLVNTVTRAYSRRPTYFVVQLSVNLDFGRKSGPIDKELDNADRENGILKGVK